MAEKKPETRLVYITRDSHLLFEDGTTVPDFKVRCDYEQKRVYMRLPGEVERECGTAEDDPKQFVQTSVDGKTEYHLKTYPLTASEFIAAANECEKTLPKKHARVIEAAKDEKQPAGPKKKVAGSKRKAERPSRIYVLTKITRDQDDIDSEVVGVFDSYDEALYASNKFEDTVHSDDENDDRSVELHIDMRLNSLNVLHSSSEHLCSESDCTNEACTASLVGASVDLFALCTEHHEERVTRQIKQDFDANEAQSQDSDKDSAAAPSPSKRTKV